MLKEWPVRFVKSPNFSSRRGSVIDCIVLHHTGTLAPKLDRFIAPDSKVSSHYVIPRNEEEGIIQLVDVGFKAWHCGRAKIWGAEHVNLFSVGVQLVATKDSGYTDFQYEACSQIIADVMNREPAVVFNRIVGHEAIVDRGNGPGPLWRWDIMFDLLVRRLYDLKIDRT